MTENCILYNIELDYSNIVTHSHDYDASTVVTLHCYYISLGKREMLLYDVQSECQQIFDHVS